MTHTRRIQCPLERQTNIQTIDMSLNSPLIRRFLFVSLILLVSSVSNSYPRSLSTDEQNSNTTTGTPAEVVQSKEREFVNFVDGECPPPKNIKLNNIDGNCENLCTTDADCRGDNKCCQIGCAFTCVEPWFPKQVLDWDNSPSSNKIHENGILEEELSGPVGGEPCSTSIFDGMEPLKCPTNYVCLITTDGDAQLNIPNRGECVSNENQEMSKTNGGSKFNDDSQNTECLHKGKKYKHEEKIRKDCNMCVCYKAVIFCGNEACPVKIGIPAAAPMSKHEHIDIDNENENENYHIPVDNEDWEESGSTQNEFDDEESGWAPQHVLLKGSSTEKSLEKKDSVSTKRLIQSTTPSPYQEKLHVTDSNSTKHDFKKSSLESAREILRSNSTVLQSSIKTKDSNLKITDVETQKLEKHPDSKVKITDDDSSVSKGIELLNETVKLVEKKQSNLTVKEKSKKGYIELRAEDIDSAQEEMEGSISGSGQERNYNSSSGSNNFESRQSGSGDRQLQNPSTGGSIPTKLTELDLQGTIYLEKQEESSGLDSGCGIMGRNSGGGDTATTNLQMSHSGSLAKDESFEYFETTDDEH